MSENHKKKMCIKYQTLARISKGVHLYTVKGKVALLFIFF